MCGRPAGWRRSRLYPQRDEAARERDPPHQRRRRTGSVTWSLTLDQPAQPWGLPPPLRGRVGVGGRDVERRSANSARPPPPTPPQPNLAIARVRPLNKSDRNRQQPISVGEG